MHYKKVKIIYFSANDSDARQLELTWGRFLSLIFAAFVMLLIVVSTTIALFTNFYQKIEIASLSKLNTVLQQQLVDMTSQVRTIESRIHGLETQDDQLRIIANLPRIDADTRDVGVGGIMNVDFPVAPDELSTDIFEHQSMLDKLERRIDLTSQSRDEIKRKLDDNQKVIKHTPSIRPLIDGVIKDRFGLRLHPIFEKIQHHKGVDISAERGTEVLASAAGTVKKVVTDNIHRGYGKHIIIDHGRGIETLYGHLSKVLVKQGERIERWKPIGLVGDTGLATGPHLHYEVIIDGEQQDPIKFILN
jgi:murein DD-endopeptidase MepM/ murein hydrolase activator NlpD